MEEQFKSQPYEEQEIDLLELAGNLWRRKWFVIKTGLIAFAVGIVIAFSIPKEYSVTVMLSPESGKTSGGGLASAASMLGFGNLSAADADALNISLFPDILASDPFALELYGMSVTPDKKEPLPLNEFIADQRQPWWGAVAKFPFKVLGWARSLFSEKEETAGTLNPFRLTKEESKRLTAIKESMSAVVDKKSYVTTITVTTQDAVVSATVADSVVRKLQDYITSYRTKKAIEDCAYLEKLYGDYQEAYYEAQQNYASYVDSNRGLYTRKSMVEGERLQNEMNQAYGMYNQVASQLQMARAKIQEAKPVFAVVNPARVPVKPSAPRKMIILVATVFLGVVCACAWILFGESIWNEFKAKAIVPAEDEEKKKIVKEKK